MFSSTTWIVSFAAIAMVAACSSPTGMAKTAEGPREKATLAGGCFWCMEPPYEGLEGVYSVVSGYSGGDESSPKYEDVARGLTGHCEAVQITFNPQLISYEALLQVYWKSMDPTDSGGQFADRGAHYRPVIFYHDENQKRAAQQSMRKLASSKRFDDAIAVEIAAFEAFYPAEEYHQDYFKKEPTHYKKYRKGSGREGYLERVWGDELNEKPTSVRYEKPSEAEIKERLDPLQYKVTQLDGTEQAFHNLYWDNKADGIYVDVVSGEPLFSSRDKFASGTGWPSFTQPLVDANVVGKGDAHRILGAEVRSKHGGSHLGHVFPDGPKPTGLRYCVNSAALRFIPAEKLEEEGYPELAALFDD